MKKCDLHCHSVFSDGTLTPKEIVNLAVTNGLSAIALTDHNTTGGLNDFKKAGKEKNIITIPGCEFSTEYNKTELHILGLFLPESSWEKAEKYVEQAHKRKHESNINLIKKLNDAGYDITYEETAKLTDAKEFNRSHVARVLFSKGYVKSVKEAFENLLHDGKGFYTPPERLQALETIRFIKECNATAVWAHPFLNMNYDEIRAFLPEAISAGLDGMECLYTEYDNETEKKAFALAYEFGLKKSGGSDFHGKGKPDIFLGSGYGNLEIPFEFYEKLKP